LVGEVVGDAEHEEVANVLDVRVVADPVTPQNIRERAEVWQEGGVGVFLVAVPGGSGCALGAIEVEAVDGCGTVSVCGGSSEGEVPPALVLMMNSKCAFVAYHL
jgi:hypothetical protein